MVTDVCDEKRVRMKAVCANVSFLAPTAFSFFFKWLCCAEVEKSFDSRFIHVVYLCI